MIIISGNPVPKARPRVTFHGTYTPAKTKKYEAFVAKCYKEQCGIKYDNSIRAYITFVFQIPKSYTKKLTNELYGIPHIKKPDTDNLVKSVLDALNGVAYEDDGIVSEIYAKKRWAKEGEEAHTEFYFEKIHIGKIQKIKNILKYFKKTKKE